MGGGGGVDLLDNEEEECGSGKQYINFQKIIKKKDINVIGGDVATWRWDPPCDIGAVIGKVSETSWNGAPSAFCRPPNIYVFWGLLYLFILDLFSIFYNEVYFRIL